MVRSFLSLPLEVLKTICFYLATDSTVAYNIENDDDFRAPPLRQELPVLDLTSISRFSRSSQTLHTIITPILFSIAASDLILTAAVETHLHRAASVGNDTAIRILLRHRPTALPSLLAIDHIQGHRTYRRPTTCAAAAGHLSTISLLHSLGDDPSESDSNIFGVGALNYAAFYGHLDACRLLVSLVGGYNPGYNTPEYQHTPLFWAAMNGHFGIVEYFLSIGADANSETPEGENMLHWLAKQYCTFMTEETRPYGDPKGDYDMAKLLIHEGCDPELVVQRDPTKQQFETPLSLALRYGNIPVARALLIEGHVNPNRPFADEDVYGDRALHYLSRHPPTDITEYRNEWIYTACFVLVLKYGAKLEALNRRGYTPLLVAIHNLNYAAVRVLLENGADPNRRTRKGKPALQVLLEGWAAEKDGRLGLETVGQEEEALHVELMTEEQKKQKKTREEKATENALRVFAELVQVLEASAVNEVNGKWGAPLHVAVKKEAQWAVQMLLRIGASPNLPDRRGMTPRLTATHIGNDTIIELLTTAGTGPGQSLDPHSNYSSISTTSSMNTSRSTGFTGSTVESSISAYPHTGFSSSALTGPPTILPELKHAVTIFWQQYMQDLEEKVYESQSSRYKHRYRIGASVNERKGKTAKNREDEEEWVWEEDYGNYDPEKGEYNYGPNGELCFIEHVMDKKTGKGDGDGGNGGEVGA